MPKPVYLMTVQEAHKEYNSLIDQIQAKFEQLDSGSKFMAVCSSAFNSECSELVHLFAHMSKLCKKTDPANAQGSLQAHTPQALKMPFQIKISIVAGSKVVEDAVLFVRIWNWLWILPAITFVVWQVPESFKTKLPPWVLCHTLVVLSKSPNGAVWVQTNPECLWHNQPTFSNGNP